MNEQLSVAYADYSLTLTIKARGVLGVKQHDVLRQCMLQDLANILHGFGDYPTERLKTYTEFYFDPVAREALLEFSNQTMNRKMSSIDKEVKA